MVLTKRDRWIVMLLPAAAVLFVYFWFAGIPLLKKADGLRRKLAGHTLDEEGYRLRIRRAAKELERAEKERAESAKQTPASAAAPGGDTPEARQRVLARHFAAASLRMVSAKRQEKPPEFRPGLFPDADGLSLWHFHVRGTYPQIQTFLSSVETNGWGIPVNVGMAPAAELGQPADWLLAVLL